jgi:hypothetical protein
VTSELSDLGAENFKSGRESETKMRLNFNVGDKDKAIAIYRRFMGRDSHIQGVKALIYLQKPEEVFVRYGDIAAAEYYKKEEERKQQQFDKKKSQQHHRGNNEFRHHHSTPVQ